MAVDGAEAFVRARAGSAAAGGVQIYARPSGEPAPARGREPATYIAMRVEE